MIITVVKLHCIWQAKPYLFSSLPLLTLTYLLLIIYDSAERQVIWYYIAQRAIPTEDVVTTIALEIYTFWRQNRPGILACPVDAAVHQPPGNIFFSDQSTHQITMSDLHYPATLSSIAGESNSGLRDGRKNLFQNPSGLCIYANLDWSQGRKMTLFSMKQVSLKTKTTLSPSLESIPPLAHFLWFQQEVCNCWDRFQFVLDANSCKIIQTSMLVTPHKGRFLS